MLLPAIVSRASMARAFCGEGACLKLERQCKPFVYLNPVDRIGGDAQKKSPAFRQGLPHLTSPKLAIGLLLTWLLVLLAGVLVGVAHSGSPFLNVAPDNALLRRWLPWNNSSLASKFSAHPGCGTGCKNNPVQAFWVRPRGVAAPGSRC